MENHGSNCPNLAQNTANLVKRNIKDANLLNSTNVRPYTQGGIVTDRVINRAANMTATTAAGSHNNRRNYGQQQYATFKVSQNEMM